MNTFSRAQNLFVPTSVFLFTQQPAITWNIFPAFSGIVFFDLEPYNTRKMCPPSKAVKQRNSRNLDSCLQHTEMSSRWIHEPLTIISI
jgi:hypothetical protein